MASDIILLSDIAWGGEAYSRYAAPYVIATALESAGYRTTVIDYFTHHPDFFGYLKNFLGPNTLFVGLSSTFLSPDVGDPRVYSPERRPQSGEFYREGYLWFARREELARWLTQLRETIDEYNPDCRVVLGGGKAWMIYMQPDEAYHGIDYFVMGEGERSAPLLARSLRQGEDVRAELKGGLRFLWPVVDHTKEDRCPQTVLAPAQAISRGEGLPIEIARGCLYNCKFCFYDKKKSIRKTLDDLREELTRNWELFGATSYHFCDDCFSDTRDKVEAVCGELMRLPFRIEWVSYARADLSIKHPETLSLMAESGCRGLLYGIETFNAEAGRAAGKAVPPDAVKRFLKSSYERYHDRILFSGSFITGLPHETVDSQKATSDWLLENRVFDWINFTALRLREYDQKLDTGVIDYPDYTLNPHRYGFDEIRFRPELYWRHKTMDLPTANSLVAEARDRWRARNGGPYFESCFMYPRARALGFSTEDIFRMAREGSPADNAFWRETARRRSAAWLEAYWKELADVTKPG